LEAETDEAALPWQAKRLLVFNPPDTNVILFDDVTAKGGSVMQAVRAVRARGATVKKIITLVDRLEGTTENLGKEGIEFVALYTTRELLG
jgi:orotate phosphoribosyltransferase